MTATAADRHARFERALTWSSSLVRGGTLTPAFIPGSDRFAFAEGEPSERRFVLVDPEAGTTAELFDRDRLRAAVGHALGTTPPGDGAPFDSCRFLDAERVAFEIDGRPVTLHLRTYEATTSAGPTAAERARMTPRRVRPGFLAGDPGSYEVPSPDGRWLLGVDDRGNVTLRSKADGRTTTVTDDAVEGRPWSVRGASWAPDGRWVLASRVDTRHMAQVPVAHWLKPQEEVEWFPYAKAGGPEVTTTLHFIDVTGRRVVDVVHGAGEERLVPIGFLPSGVEVLYLAVSRTTDRAALIAADRTTGATREIVAEQSTFFNWGELHRLVSLVPDGKSVLWRSQRSGWAHLHRYGLDGTELAQVTAGDFPVLDVFGFDLDGGWVYFTAHPDRERRYDTHLCRAALDGSSFEQLTSEPGQHRGQLTPSGRFVIDHHSHVDRPPAVDLRRATGETVARLSQADTSRLDDFGWRPPRELVVKAADGVTDLHALLYEPWGLDPSQPASHPIVDGIYGGPQACNIPRGFADEKGYMDRALAAAGFAVLVVDARGTPERSKAFHDVVHRSFGTHEIPDHAAALAQVAAGHPWIDTTRVGIFGGSWGGYMTIRALVTAPETYHVGVATNPVADLEDHMAGPIEGFMGLPQDNPEGYAAASSHPYVDRLVGKLCLIHGTSDVNATFSATMKLVASLMEAGKPYDLVVLPEVDHIPTGTARKYWLNCQYRYLAEHLRLGQEAPVGR